MTAPKRLWYDSQQTRFFLIPADKTLPVGSFTLQSLGTSCQVDLAAIADYEVATTVAQAHQQAAVVQALALVQEALAQAEKRTGTQRWPTLDTEQLRKALANSRQPADLATHLASLQQWLARAEQGHGDPAELGKEIDTLIASLERSFGPLLGGPTPAQTDAERTQRYRANARDAIARSLRAHGITPAQGTDEP
jgi:hypothetical protein